MNYIAVFYLGLFVGVATMCMMQISKYEDEEKGCE